MAKNVCDQLVDACEWDAKVLRLGKAGQILDETRVYTRCFWNLEKANRPIDFAHHTIAQRKNDRQIVFQKAPTHNPAPRRGKRRHHKRLDSVGLCYVGICYAMLCVKLCELE